MIRGVGLRRHGGCDIGFPRRAGGLVGKVIFPDESFRGSVNAARSHNGKMGVKRDKIL